MSIRIKSWAIRRSPVQFFRISATISSIISLPMISTGMCLLISAYDRAGGVEVTEMRRDKAFYVRLYCDLAQISGTGMRPSADARFGPEFDCGGWKRTLVD